MNENGRSGQDGSTEDTAAIRQRLAEVAAARGYLLPHHGLLAVAAPALLEAYDRTYRALTLTARRLSDHDKEFVWLAILIATDEAIATHHIAKFRAAGGTTAGIDAALRLVALARGASAFRFVDRHWNRHVPGWSRPAAWKEARRAVLGPDAPSMRLVLMAEAATHVCLGQWRELEVAIEEAYEAGVDEFDLAEALTLTMFPAGVPGLVEAAGVWLELIRAGRVTPSPAFRVWAETKGQGGFDEAASQSTAEPIGTKE